MAVPVFLIIGSNDLLSAGTKPRTRMEHILDRGLTSRELVALNNFDGLTMSTPKGTKLKPVPKTWLPHASFILINLAMSAFGFCQANPHGKDSKLLWKSDIVFSFRTFSYNLDI